MIHVVSRTFFVKEKLRWREEVSCVVKGHKKEYYEEFFRHYGKIFNWEGYKKVSSMLLEASQMVFLVGKVD